MEAKGGPVSVANPAGKFPVLSQNYCIKRIKEYIRASGVDGTFIVSKRLNGSER